MLRVPQAYCYRCPFELTHPNAALFCVRYRQDDDREGGSEPPVALIMEPMQANGGMIEFPADYYPAIRKMCDEFGMLLIWDEIQTGFGRVGDVRLRALRGLCRTSSSSARRLAGGFPLSGSLLREDLQRFHAGATIPSPSPISRCRWPQPCATLRRAREERLLERSRRSWALTSPPLENAEETSTS